MHHYGATTAGLTIKSVTGAGVSGSTYYTKATITLNWSATTPSSLISKYELLVDGKTVATTSVPITLAWKATDSASLKEVRLTAPVAKIYGPTTSSAPHTAKSGAATAWNMIAHDQAGNSASASVSGTPVILQETSAIRTGSWTARSSTSYLGGKSYSSSSKNAALTWSFTGESVAWVVSRASSSGQAYVYVDGSKVVTLDLKSSTTRDAIWTKNWSTSAKHTVKIVVVGTAGRPTVTTDGIVYLK